MSKKLKFLVTGMIVLILSIMVHNTQETYYTTMDSIRSDFGEAIDVAMVTTRFQLGDEIRELRGIEQRLDNISRPFWITNKTPQTELAIGMQMQIDAFVAFLAQDMEVFMTKMDNSEAHFAAYDNLRL
jgi:hypothetical protein